MNGEPPTVGDVLRRTLDAQAVSQVELAEHADLSPKHVNQVLSDTVDLSPDVAVRFARALGIPAQVWLGIDAARHDWEIAQAEPGPAEPVMPKVRRQRDEARAQVARLERQIEKLAAANTDEGLRARLSTVRAVADEWRRFALERTDHGEAKPDAVAWKAMAHALCCVLAAVDGGAGPVEGAYPEDVITGYPDHVIVNGDHSGCHCGGRAP